MKKNKLLTYINIALVTTTITPFTTITSCNKQETCDFWLKNERERIIDETKFQFTIQTKKYVNWTIEKIRFLYDGISDEKIELSAVDYKWVNNEIVADFEFDVIHKLSEFGIYGEIYLKVKSPDEHDSKECLMDCVLYAKNDLEILDRNVVRTNGGKGIEIKFKQNCIGQLHPHLGSLGHNSIMYANEHCWVSYSTSDHLTIKILCNSSKTIPEHGIDCWFNIWYTFDGVKSQSITFQNLNW